MDYTIVHKHALPTAPVTSTATFEGSLHQASISFFWVALLPGRGVQLHRHPCEEIFIIEAGQVAFTIGSARLDARAGDIITVAPHVPHRFWNTGDDLLRQIDILPVPHIVTEWLEEE